MLAVEPLDALPEAARRELVERVLSDPAIARRLMTDRGPAAYVAHPSIRYLSALVAGRVLGFFALVRRSLETIEIHVALLREALPAARRLGRLAVTQAFSDPTVQRVVALVLEGLESARNYAVRCGFVLESFETGRTTVDGRPRGAWRLVAHRAQWSPA